MATPFGPLVATYSIVARDPETGQLGVGVQSSYFSVGSQVSWSVAGVGAVATQSIIEVAYGPKALELLGQGASASEALEQLVEADAGAALRQVAIVDAKGRVATHTGGACVPASGHAVGDGYSVQGNMLASDAVWQAMGPAFEQAEGDLAERMMAALDAAEAAGGDVRGRQSAALLVTSGEACEHAWEGRLFDVRVDDHSQPLAELRRLVTIERAFALFEEARGLIGQGQIDASLELANQALELQPGHPQFCFWTGLALANAGRNDEARRYLSECFAANDGWRELALRLAGLGAYTGDPGLLEP